MEKMKDAIDATHDLLIDKLEGLSREISALKTDIVTFKVDVAVLKKDLESNQKLTQWMMGLYAAGFAIVFTQIIARILK